MIFIIIIIIIIICPSRGCPDFSLTGWYMKTHGFTYMIYVNTSHTPVEGAHSIIIISIR